MKRFIALFLAIMLSLTCVALAEEIRPPKVIPDAAPEIGMADPTLALPANRGPEQGINSAADIPVVYLEDPDFTDSSKYISVIHVTAIGDVLEDGLALSTIRLEMDDVVPTALLKPDCFEVPGRTVIHTYVNDSGVVGETKHSGKYVFVELLTNEAPDSNQFKETSGQFSFGYGASSTWAIDLPICTSIRMVKSVYTPEGKSIAPFNKPNDDQYINIVDELIPGKYTDPKTGVTIKYNLLFRQIMTVRRNTRCCCSCTAQANLATIIALRSQHIARDWNMLSRSTGGESLLHHDPAVSHD